MSTNQQKKLMLHKKVFHVDKRKMILQKKNKKFCAQKRARHTLFADIFFMIRLFTKLNMSISNR